MAVSAQNSNTEWRFSTMIHVQVGNDWYGSVKHVGTSRVATAFFHVSLFPCYPIYSSVLSPPGGAEPDWEALPLARIDRASVVAAYVRGVAGTLLILGFIPLLFGCMFWLNNAQTTMPPATIASGGGLLAGTGVVIGALSYLAWRAPSNRERAIREVAAVQLGVAADPALLTRHYADQWIECVDRQLAEKGIADYRTAVKRPREYPEDVRRLLLLRVRGEIGAAGNNATFEQHTDELLNCLGIVF